MLVDIQHLDIQTVLTIYKRLCIAEVRKYLQFYPEMMDGFQNGYISCITDFFGQCPEDEMQRNYDAGTSYIHILDRIVKEKLQDFVDSQIGKVLDVDDLDTITKFAELAVDEYAIDHIDEMVTSVKCL